MKPVGSKWATQRMAAMHLCANFPFKTVFWISNCHFTSDLHSAHHTIPRSPQPLHSITKKSPQQPPLTFSITNSTIIHNFITRNFNLLPTMPRDNPTSLQMPCVPTTPQLPQLPPVRSVYPSIHHFTLLLPSHYCPGLPNTPPFAFGIL